MLQYRRINRLQVKLKTPDLISSKRVKTPRSKWSHAAFHQHCAEACSYRQLQDWRIEELQDHILSHGSCMNLTVQSYLFSLNIINPQTVTGDITTRLSHPYRGVVAISAEMTALLIYRQWTKPDHCYTHGGGGSIFLDSFGCTHPRVWNVAQ